MATLNRSDIEAAVTADIQAHKENGVSLNPYSTHRARQSWVNGFGGEPFALLDWADCYQRGKVAAQLFTD